MLAHLNLVSKACLLHSIHDYMPRTAQHARAFHFCKNLFLLLATSLDAPCKDCSLSSTYLAYDASVVRKRRVAKPKEVFDATRPPSQRPVAFSIAQGRTAKHKSHSWTADSSVSRTVLGGNGLRRHETITHVHTSAHIHPLLNANRHHHPWWWSSSRLSFPPTIPILSRDPLPILSRSSPGLLPDPLPILSRSSPGPLPDHCYPTVSFVTLLFRLSPYCSLP